MTAGISIGIDAKGGAQAAADVKKVEQATLGLAAAEHKAGAAAHARGKAQHDANKFGYRTEQARGDHGGLLHNLHIAGMAGGEIGHIGHRLGRAGHFGVAGLAVGGLGLAGSLVFEAMEHFNEAVKETVKKAHEIHETIEKAGLKSGATGLSAYDANRSAFRRIAAAGGNWDETAQWQKKGLAPDAQAELREQKNWQLGAKVSLLAERLFGADSSGIAKAIASAGGLRPDADPIEAAGYYAGNQQGRRIDTKNVRLGSQMSSDLDTIQGLEDKGRAGSFGFIANGKAASAAAQQLNETLNPGAAAMSKTFAEVAKADAVFRDLVIHSNQLLDILKNMGVVLGKDGGSLYEYYKHKRESAEEMTYFPAAGAKE